MLTNGIVALLNANAAITSICGNSIQPIPAPDERADYPCVTYQVASDLSEYSLTNQAGPTQSRIVFNCIASTYVVARSLALAIKSALSSFTGTLPDGTFVNETEIVNMQDGFDDGSRLSTTSVHAVFYYAG
jgi:Protein of unknown function (DUF3168)